MAVDAGKIRCAKQKRMKGTASIDFPLRRTAFYCETQIGHIDDVSLSTNTHQAVLRLDISVNDPTGMDILEKTDELVGEHQDGFEREFTATETEIIFQIRA